MYSLFGFKNSGSAAVECALEMTGAPYRIVETASWEPGPELDELERVNPLKQIPTLQLPGGYSYRVDNIPETAAQIDQSGPAQPSAITVTTSSSSQYRITVSADGGAVTID